MPRINPPGYTQLPNVVLDNMSEMGDAELRIVLAICRKTFGWQKTYDTLSLTQLEKLTGLSRPSVVSGTEAAINNGWVTRNKKGNSFEYRLLVKEIDQSEGEGSKVNLPDIVKPLYQNSPEIVNLLNTQKKDIKEKKEPLREPHPRERTPLEIELKSLEDLFCKLSGLPAPAPNTAKEKLSAAQRWYQPMRRMQKLCNGTTGAIIEKAIKRMRSDRLTIAAPQSIESVVMSIHGERATTIKKPEGKIYE